MDNFEFRNPTKLIFGKGSISKLRDNLPKDKRVMITFGGGSVKQNGVYDQVIAALEGYDIVEFWGIEPNPRVETVRKAVALARAESVGYFLAVGGGSTLDATKVIAAATVAQEDAWEIVLKGVYTGASLPVAAVLTLPATGSEMNAGSVISNDATNEKYAVYTYHPEFSILDPEATYSLPAHQVACGLADTFVHVLEQYLIAENASPLMDRWAEGILMTVCEIAPRIKAEPTNYEHMSNFMLCATMALNGFVSMGVHQDWTTHMIGHELTALTGLTHGHTLTIVLPGVMDVLRDQKGSKILQFGERVFGVTVGSPDERITATIVATEEFFRSLGLKTRLAENGVGDEVVAQLVARLEERQTRFGERANVTFAEVAQILALRK